MYNWGIIGAGWIANDMADALKRAYGSIYAISSRTKSKAEKTAERCGIKKVYSTTEELLDDANVDIVYIATPHNTHYEILKKAVLAGKHVLCEKAITLNSKELEDVLKLAKEKQVIVAEAMTIYHMPLYNEINKKISEGVIGEVSTISVNFGSVKEYDPENRFYNPCLAGGALLDIGVYALSFVRCFLKSAPNNILTNGEISATGVDVQSSIILNNIYNQTAAVTLSFKNKQPKRGVVCGEKGYIEIDNYPRADKAVIYYNDGSREEVCAGDSSKALEYEAINFEEAVKIEESPKIDFTVDVMNIMDQARKIWGFKYPEEM